MPAFEVSQGDCLDVLAALEPDSVDAFAEDPPYGLSFMGRGWDHAVPGPEFFDAQLRVAKPGAHLVACGGTRVHHRLMCSIEDAGWEIRDCLQWMYGSGFPKSLDVSKAIDKAAGVAREVVGMATRPDGTQRPNKADWSPGTAGTYAQDEWTRSQMAKGGNDLTAPATDAAKQWDGWGTALKPSWEPIILARKPFPGTIAANVQRWGTGALNVDGCRVGTSKATPASPRAGQDRIFGTYGAQDGSESGHDPNIGRWPANTVLGCACEHEHEPGCAVAMLDEQSGERVSGTRAAGTHEPMGFHGADPGPMPAIDGSSGGASRFFYTAKASRSEREAGLEHRQRRNVNDGRETSIDNAYQRGDTQRANTHPTVKPVSLMRWLVRLITPPGGLVLDAFAGSGTTGVACVYEGFRFHGIELEAEHCEIARSRIAQAQEDVGTMSADEADRRHEETGQPVQIGLFGDEPGRARFVEGDR